MAEVPPPGGGTQGGLGGVPGTPGRGFMPSAHTPVLPTADGTTPGFRPLGGSNPGSLLQGLNGVVTNIVAAQRETERVAKDILASSERTATLMGNVLDRAQTLLMMTGAFGGYNGVVGRRAYAPVTGMGLAGMPAYVGPGAVPMGGMGPSMGPPPAEPPAPAGGPSVVPEPTVPGTGLSRDPRRHPDPGVPEGRSRLPSGPDWPNTWEQGKHFDLGSLRQNVARGVNRRVSEWGTGAQQRFRAEEATIMPDGTLIPKGGFLPGSRAVPSGSPPFVRGRMVMNESGELVPEALEMGGWRAGAANVGKNFMGSLAEGGGLGESLSAIGPAVGGTLAAAGAIYVGVNKGLDFSESQRRQNMAFQSVLGGSNAEGFEERWKQNLFRMSVRGTMGGGDAEAIYKAAMENYGTQRGMRNDYQGAAVDLYRNAGVSSQESIQLLNQAAEAGNDNVRELADALVGLGKVAREAGEGAQDARRYFTEAMGSLQPFAGGSVQIQGAAQEAATRISLGDRYSDTSFDSQNSRMSMVRMAQNLGVDYSAFSASVASGNPLRLPNGRRPSGAMALAEGKRSLALQAMASFDPTGRVVQAIKQRMDDRGFTKKGASQEQITDLAAEIQTEFGINPMQLSGILNTVGGIQTTDADAMGLFVNLAFNEKANPIKIQEAHDREMTRKRQFDVNLKGGEGIGKPRTDDEKALSNFLYKDLGLNKNSYTDTHLRGGKLNTGEKRSAKDMLDEGTFHRGISKYEQLKRTLANQATKGQTVNAYGYQIFKNWESFGDDARFVVKTKGGGERSVDAQELVQFYGDQLRNDPGAITIQGGKHSGETVGKVLDLRGTGLDASDTRSAKSGDLAKKGKSVKDGAKDTNDTTGRVEIVPDPWLRQFFKFRNTGSAYDSGSAYYWYQQGLPPPSNASTPPEGRAGG